MDKIDKLLSKMSVAEKALLCSGRDFWFTRAIKKYGIERYMVTDGPHGLRKQSETADNLGINDSIHATCFPPACLMASTWDKELIEGVGQRIGEEAKEEKVGIVLGPGANIKRSPLCGRNFEYFSEDPYLSSHCAAALINGIQKTGIGTSLKHFAVNNQENDRMRVDAVIDERALREIYLKSFEYAVKEAKPYTVMCSYNKVNGEYVSQNKKLLTDILRDEWGYKGYVMSDWGAVFDRVQGLKSGLDLEMPGGSGESVQDIVKAVAEGRLELEVLDTTVRRLLEINFKVQEARESGYKYDRDEHHAYVRKVAGEGAVLLKNDSGILPLQKDEKVTVIGSLFKYPRYQGSGSSLIKPNKLVSGYEAFENAGIPFQYAEGFSHISDEPDDKLIEEAVNLAAAGGNKIIVFAGLTMYYESEGFDRKHTDLPKNQNLLIEKLQGLHKDIIVVLHGGSPVEIPWINGVNAIVNMYLSGQAAGEAALDVLFGNVNPSGKLPETYPIKLEDNPSYRYFPQGPVSTEYRESIFAGYRYYDTAAKNVLFPFGFGLSYTTFEYGPLVADKTAINEAGEIKLKCAVKNTGNRAGKEIVQIYVRKLNSAVFRPEKELKAFTKLALLPGEEKTAEFALNADAFSYYNTAEGRFVVEAGEYDILAGASSRDIHSKVTIQIDAPEVKNPYEGKDVSEYFAYNGKVSDAAFEAVLGYKPPINEMDEKPITMETTVYEARVTLLGRAFYKVMMTAIGMMFKAKDENSILVIKFMKDMVATNCIRSMATTNGGMMSLGMAYGILDVLNGKFFRGIFKLIKAAIANAKYDKMFKKLENEESAPKE